MKKTSHLNNNNIAAFAGVLYAAGGGSIQNRTCLLRGGEDREPLCEQPWLKLSNPRPSYTLAPTHARVSPTPLEGACTVCSARRCAHAAAPLASAPSLCPPRPRPRPRRFALARSSPVPLSACLSSLSLSSHAPHTHTTRHHRRHRLSSDFRPLLRVSVGDRRPASRHCGSQKGASHHRVSLIMEIATPVLGAAAPVSYFEARVRNVRSQLHAILYRFFRDVERNISVSL